MVNWFASEKNCWLSAKEGNEILLEKTVQQMDSIRATGCSLKYKQELKRYFFLFAPSAINEIVDNKKFSSYISSINSEKFEIMYRTTQAPEFPTAKVRTALKVILTNGESSKFQGNKKIRPYIQARRSILHYLDLEQSSK